MKKRGISAIVATVLIVLITVAAITIIWGAIIPMIREGASFDETEVSLLIDEASGYTYYDAVKKVACVQVRRGADDYNLSRIDVFFGFNGTSYISNFTGEDIPGPNEAKSKCFNLEDYDTPESVKVAPIIWKGNKEIVGSVTSDISGIKPGVYPESAVIPANLDRPVSSSEYRFNLDEDPSPDSGCDGGCAVPSSEFVCNAGNTARIENITTPTCEGISCVNVYSEGDIRVCDVGDICEDGACVALPPIGISECDKIGFDGQVETYRLAESGREYYLENNVKPDLGVGTEPGCFEVNADGITFDLGGYAIDPENEHYLGMAGISLYGHDDVVIKNGYITSFNWGLFVGNANNIIIENIEINSPTDGMIFDDVTNSNVSNVVMYEVPGTALKISNIGGLSNNIFTRVTVTHTNNMGSEGVHISSDGNKFFNLVSSGYQYGVYISNSDDNEFSNSNLYDNSGADFYCRGSGINVDVTGNSYSTQVGCDSWL